MLNLTVLSPEKTVLDITCNSVTLPSAEGQITVYPHHTALYALITHGELVAHTASGDISLAIGSGFADITAQKVVVLANFGIKSDEIDVARAQAAKARADEILKHHTSEQDMALAQAELSRSLIELKLANKRKIV